MLNDLLLSIGAIIVTALISLVSAKAWYQRSKKTLTLVANALRDNKISRRELQEIINSIGG